MIAFLLYTIMALLANACIARIIYISIQDGQWLDILLDWQARLRQWDQEGRSFLVKAGGYCELCFSHAITFICFWSYVFVMNIAIDEWITQSTTNLTAGIIINAVWYLAYISIGTNLSLYFINLSHSKQE